MLAAKKIATDYYRKSSCAATNYNRDPIAGLLKVTLHLKHTSLEGILTGFARIGSLTCIGLAHAVLEFSRQSCKQCCAGVLEDYWALCMRLADCYHLNCSQTSPTKGQPVFDHGRL